jgi:hypothetical protein
MASDYTLFRAREKIYTFNRVYEKWKDLAGAC